MQQFDPRHRHIMITCVRCIDTPVSLLLSSGCEDIIAEAMTIDSLPSVLHWSSKPHGSAWVHRQALQFLREEFSQLVQPCHLPVLYELSHDYLVDAVSSDFLQVGSSCFPVDMWLCRIVQPNWTFNSEHMTILIGHHSSRCCLRGAEACHIVNQYEINASAAQIVDCQWNTVTLCPSLQYVNASTVMTDLLRNLIDLSETASDVHCRQTCIQTHIIWDL